MSTISCRNNAIPATQQRTTNRSKMCDRGKFPAQNTHSRLFFLIISSKFPFGQSRYHQHSCCFVPYIRGFHRKCVTLCENMCHRHIKIDTFISVINKFNALSHIDVCCASYSNKLHVSTIDRTHENIFA